MNYNLTVELPDDETLQYNNISDLSLAIRDATNRYYESNVVCLNERIKELFPNLQLTTDQCLCPKCQ